MHPTRHRERRGTCYKGRFLALARNGCRHRGRPFDCLFVNAPCRPPVHVMFAVFVSLSKWLRIGVVRCLEQTVLNAIDLSTLNPFNVRRFVFVDDLLDRLPTQGGGWFGCFWAGHSGWPAVMRRSSPRSSGPCCDVPSVAARCGSSTSPSSPAAL